MNTKIALITGITGQDEYFLTRLLLKKGYEVHWVTYVINFTTKETHSVESLLKSV